ncbi:hypothetical protein COV58_03255 [Candidatus Roizmanbacteria bacterium CG11_big_fil_rev_8_21_14_0_20_36_8]|uniref:AI-2E family transporter n=2 Tax=Candidatus Roizmaniibacteriota TaxID=1752723 RepID=A0A2M6IU51_9BACT|nr:MAG: hypothetical protein COV58_03255 [Candidatus Roizmanbacteria bacterium CG11_big_fil_rev_8_21_14_0_20_36_8]PIZ64678.1 MAG: hypothetical protein COY14_04185 [Candidatus Roizmanbacteria bacterium CG_4_10_14_0_2_um_filter_36_9]
MKGEGININISPKTIALFTLIPLGLYFLWFVRDLLFSLLIAFILMSAMRPAVVALVKYKIPRALAVVLVYLGFILFFALIISIIIPPIILEGNNLLKNLPSIVEDLIPNIENYVNLNDLGQYAPNVTNNIFGFITVVFSNTLFLMTTLFFGVYFLLEENLVDRFIHRYIKKQDADKLSETLSRAEHRMSRWFWGEATLMTVVGVLTYIGLTALGIRYALPLAVLAGLLEVVPNIGPIFSAIPAVIIGLSQSYFIGFSSVILYIVVQQLENNLIVPIIMKRAVGLNPIMTLLALLIGGRVGGILGVLLAIPILLIIETIMQSYAPSGAVKPRLLYGKKLNENRNHL